MRYLLSICLLCVARIGLAQLLLAPGGSLWVQPGTSLRIDGAVDWVLPNGSVLVNDGLIDLGTIAAFQEAPDAWITGAGSERAERTFAQPMNQENLAGLGLALTTASAPGTVVVSRGHLPATMADGRVSVERWFETSTTIGDPSGTLRFIYAPSILNNIAEGDLLMHRFDALGNLWLPLPGVVDMLGQAVEANVPQVNGRFTLFADSATVAVAAVAAQEGLRAHPSPATDHVTLRHSAGRPLGLVRLVDARGRAVDLFDATHRDHLVVDVTKLAPGRYLLLTHDGRSATFLRP